LFVLGAYVSFRAVRDVWLVVVAATVVIALASDRDRWPDNWVTWPRAVVVAGSVAAVIVGVAWARNVSPQGLAVALAREFPVQAAAAIEAGGYRGPVFNPYDWGGYLIWRLPQLSVSMDGRSNLHGDARVARSLATWRGSRTWAADPELAMATLVIGPTDIALTSLLRRDAGFVVVYEDDVATVFAARDAVAARR
jgi:hypothetical protein